MELRYLGFDQKENIRTYRFDRTVKGEAAERVFVTADLALFRKHQVAIQEGPALCARKLATALATGGHQITNEDLLGFASKRAAVEERRAELRRVGARRRNAIHPAARPAGAEPSHP